MKKTLVSALTSALVVGAASTTFAAANPFADVPADHWAYDAVAQLVQDGIVNGYGAEGTFKGDQNLSRYEMAQIVAKAMAKSDAADKGSWGAYVAYRSLAPFAAFEATYDHKEGFDRLNSLKGWEIGADYAWAKNIVSTLKYFNGKDTLLTTDDKVTGVWSRVDFLF